MIIFDIGGTRMRIAFSTDGKSFEEPRIIATPKNFSSGIATLLQGAKEVARARRITEVCGGVPGPLDPSGNALLSSPHLPGWAGKPLREELRSAFGVPLYLMNDTALVGLGEAVVGAGKGHPIVAYLGVGTGVGGVRVVDGSIDKARIGFEPGHQIIDRGGAHCKMCAGGPARRELVEPGHLEEYISGAALERRLGKKPEDILNPVVWEELARHLAYGLNNTILHWSPDIVVLGGSMIVREVGIKIPRVRAHLAKILTIIPPTEHPPIISATLGDFGGLHGALALIRTRGRM